MRLTLAIHPITEMRFGSATKLAGTRLEIDKDDLRKHLMEDPRLASVDLEIVRPGESARIGLVFDILEPRAKEPGSGPDFPGIIGPYAPVGQGTTHVLRGAAVSVVDEGTRPSPSGTRGGSKIVEMSGPAAEASPYGKLQHLIVVPHARPDAEWHTAFNAMRVASCKAAVYLARAAMGQRPASQEVFDLEGPSIKGREGLPRIAYVGQIHNGHHGTDVDEHIFYGSNLIGYIPTVAHPNEWLDGAIVLSYTHNSGGETYFYQNNPIVLDLYRRHQAGRITFVGTIVTSAPGVEDERRRNVMVASNLAQWNLRADGIVADKHYGGAPHTDMFETARLCEAAGIRSVVTISDSAPDRRAESAALMNIPEVSDMVVVGGTDIHFQVPAAERVIAGNPAQAAKLGPSQELTANQVAGVANQQGASKLQSILY